MIFIIPTYHAIHCVACITDKNFNVNDECMENSSYKGGGGEI